MKITIRKPNAGESIFLSELALKSKAHWGYNQKLIEAWRKELIVSEEMLKTFITYVAFDGNKIIGFWSREPVEKLSAGRLFIDPEYIGKGIGKLLWSSVMKEAKNRGLKCLIWEADPNAEPFYLKMGAKRINLKKSSVVPDRMIPIMRFDL